MITLEQFNQLSPEEARTLLTPCVALPDWVSQLSAQRPFTSQTALLQAAAQAMQLWGEAELEQALSTHPRIGEKPVGAQQHAAFSRQEQSAVDTQDSALAQALKQGNAEYEARFGRVFLIRAKERSGEEMLQALQQRLNNSNAEEVEEALTQLREITLLRLEGVISE